MCGIAGIIAPPSLTIPEYAIERMTMALRHRGPDEEGWARRPLCHLGHTRLSIIDPVGGKQPMADASGRFCLVYNGEIYNYRELRAALSQEGHRFATASDTEVLLRILIARGAAAAKQLAGQFAFALWDSQERRLLAGRDRFGEKPLYYAQTAEGYLILASEIKAILASGLVDPVLDLISLDLYLGLGYVPPFRTIYANIAVLPPGHVLHWQDGSLRQERFFTLRLGDEGVEAEAAPQRLRRLIVEAAWRQTVADVPVGIFLSGGLDSSTIVACLAEAGLRLQTFAVGFRDLIDERPYARAVAERYGTEHHEIEVAVDVAAMLERMAEVFDEPFADSSCIPCYLLAEFARQHVKVVLSGEGGDELFGGYSWYDWLRWSEGLPDDALTQWRWLFAAAWHKARRWLGGPPLPNRASPAFLRHLVKLRRRYPDLWQRHLALTTFLWADRSRLWGRKPPDVEAALLPLQPSHDCRRLDRAVYFDVVSYLAGDLLVKVDRMAMAHGLEVRAPFLDNALTAYVWGLPAEARFAGNDSKHLLRLACADLWPENVRQRGKQGFGAPIAAWLREPAVMALWQRVTRPHGPLRELLPGATHWPRTPQQQWTILTLGLWLERRTACLHRLSRS